MPETFEINLVQGVAQSLPGSSRPPQRLKPAGHCRGSGGNQQLFGERIVVRFCEGGLMAAFGGLIPRGRVGVKTGQVIPIGVVDQKGHPPSHKTHF